MIFIYKLKPNQEHHWQQLKRCSGMVQIMEDIIKKTNWIKSRLTTLVKKMLKKRVDSLEKIPTSLRQA